MTSEQLLSQEFAVAHTMETAKVLEELPAEERISFLEEVSPELGAKLAQLMAPSLMAADLERMAEAKAAEILANIPPEAGSLFLRRMDQERRGAILSNLPQTVREQISLLLRYPENTAGALMEPRVFTLFEDQTVGEAISQISLNPDHVLYYIPVTDRQQALKGVVCIRELMSAKPESLLAAVTESGVAQLSADLRRDAILGHPGWRFFHDLPVVDRRGCLLGVLSYRTLRHLEGENGEHPGVDALSETSKALGELYWLGISALVKGTSSLVTDKKQ